MSATSLERQYADVRAALSCNPPEFQTSFHAAANAVCTGQENAVWRDAQTAGPAAIAGHIEGVAAIRARRAPQYAFLKDSAAFRQWPGGTVRRWAA